MQFRIIQGKLRILLDADHFIEQQEILVEAIGSAHPQADGLPEVSCTLSVSNLRKLRRLFPDIRRFPDEETNQAIAALQVEQRATDAENELARRIKTDPAFQAIDDYVFKLKPFAHQILGFQFMRHLESPALFGDCGVGKTMIVATTLDYLCKRGDKVIGLVVCPVNLIKHAWMEDIAKFTDLLPVSLRQEHWNPGMQAKMREDALATDADIYLVNPENVRTEGRDKAGEAKLRSAMALLRRKRKAGYKVWLIIDESSRIKSRTSAIYRALRKLRTLSDRCVIMTGTPSPNGVLDLWAQFHILDGGKTLQPSFVDYRHDAAKKVRLGGLSWKDKGGNVHPVEKWVEKKGVATEIYKTIEPRMIRFRTEDCIDLPPKRFITRNIVLSAAQKKAYAEMEERLFLELEGEPVTARVAVARLMKLREITGGFVISDNAKAIPIDKEATPKMVELDALLEQSVAEKMGDEGAPPTKALIWAQYRWECETMIARYRRGYGARGLFGGISSTQKDSNISAFKSDPTCRLLVCHPQSVGHGLTLVQASYVFYYSLSENYEEFYQSARRVARPGQTRPMTYYFLVAGGTIDEDIVETLAEKKNVSDIITDGQFRRDGFMSRRQNRRVKEFDLAWNLPGDTNAGTTDLPPLKDSTTK
jgi:SNF2 family DNA or RNA helicase